MKHQNIDFRVRTSKLLNREGNSSGSWPIWEKLHGQWYDFSWTLKDRRGEPWALCSVVSFDLFRRFCKAAVGEQKHSMLLPSTSPGPVGWHPKREVDTLFPYYMDPVQRNWLSTLNFCHETSSQLIMWFWSQEKWIHFHFLGLPLKLLREDNYFPSSKYFLTSFSWKWQSGSAPGWQIQP